MKNKNMAFLLVLIGLLWAIPMVSRSEQPPSIREQLDTFMFSEEFKADEIAKLQALPMGAVAILTSMLDKAKTDDPDEARIFYCLAKKFIQHENDLPAKERTQTAQVLIQKLKAAPISARKWKALPLRASMVAEIKAALAEMDNAGVR